jgi:protein translocase SEC61 complex gamma subunit
MKPMKPTRDEYRVIVKVSGLGILAIGFIGFIIHIIGMIITK